MNDNGVLKVEINEDRVSSNIKFRELILILLLIFLLALLLVSSLLVSLLVGTKHGDHLLTLSANLFAIFTDFNLR